MPSLLAHLLTGFDARILRVDAPGEQPARTVLSTLLAALKDPPATALTAADCLPRGCTGRPPTLDDTWQSWCARTTAVLIDPGRSTMDERLAGTGGHDSTVVEYSAGPDSGHAHALPPGTWTLGRTHDADRPVADPFLSRTPLLVGNGPGGLTVHTHDCGEYTVPIDPAGPRSLRLGSTRLSIHPTGPPADLGPVSLRWPEPPEVRPPEAPSWIFYLLPLVLGIVLVLVTGMWWFLLFTLSGPLTAGVRWRMETRRWKRESAESVVDYRQALTDYAAEVSPRIDLATGAAAATPLESGLVVLGYGRALSPDTLTGHPTLDSADRRADRNAVPPGITRLLDRFSVPAAVIDGSSGAITIDVGSRGARSSTSGGTDGALTGRDAAGERAAGSGPVDRRTVDDGSIGTAPAGAGSSGTAPAGTGSTGTGSSGTGPAGTGSAIGRSSAGGSPGSRGPVGSSSVGSRSVGSRSVGSSSVGNRSVGSGSGNQGTVHPVLEDCALLFDPSAADLDISGVPEVVGDIVLAVIASGHRLGLPVSFVDSSVIEAFPELTGYGVDLTSVDDPMRRTAHPGITVALRSLPVAPAPSGSRVDLHPPDDREGRPHALVTPAGVPSTGTGDAFATARDGTLLRLRSAVPDSTPSPDDSSPADSTPVTVGVPVFDDAPRTDPGTRHPVAVRHRPDDSAEQVTVSIRCPASAPNVDAHGRAAPRASPTGGVVPRWRIDCPTPLSTAELSLTDPQRPRRHPVPLGGTIELRRLRPERFLRLVPPPAAPAGTVPPSRTLAELLTERDDRKAVPEDNATGATGGSGAADADRTHEPGARTDARAGPGSARPHDWSTGWGSAQDNTAPIGAAANEASPTEAAEPRTASTAPAPAGAARVPLGSTATGALLIDLVEDGPHALVAGTTGSGKSVLLQTWVTALSAALSPDELRFVLIDFKGGAAFAPFAELVHVDAVVDNLEPTQAMRALRSLRAEILRREALLAEQRCPDIDTLNAAAHARGRSTTLPRIVVVIDEFQALVQDNPAGVEMIESLTALGRSLGIHLVLATQRPSGIVTSRMKANITLRIALRVRDSADSIEVIGTEAAAHLRPDDPGAALLSRAGPPELFRAAQVSTTRSTPTATLPRVEWTALLGRRPSPRSSPRHTAMTGSAVLPTSGPAAAALTVPALVEASRHFLTRSTGDRRRIVLPPMPSSHSPASPSDLGLLDFPDENRTERWVWDPARDGSVIITGGRGRGTSTAVRALAAAAMSSGHRVVHLTRNPSGLHQAHRPEVRESLEVGRRGEGITGPDACTGPGEYVVADHAEVWTVEYLLGLLETDVDPEPMMICIDDFDALRRTLEGTRRLTRLEALLTAGPGRAPVSFVVAAGRRILHSPVAAQARTRVVFPPADAQETAHLGIPTRRFSGVWPPGRAVILGPVAAAAGAQGADVQLSHLSSDPTALGHSAPPDPDGGSPAVRASMIDAHGFDRRTGADHWVHRSAHRRSGGTSSFEAGSPTAATGTADGAALMTGASPRGPVRCAGVEVGVGPCGEPVTWIPDVDGPVLSVRAGAALAPRLVASVEQAWILDGPHRPLVAVPEAHLADPPHLTTAFTAPACVIGYPLQHTPGYSSPLARAPGLGPTLVIGARTAGELAEVGLRELTTVPGGSTRGWFVTAERAIPVDVAHLLGQA